MKQHTPNRRLSNRQRRHEDRLAANFLERKHTAMLEALKAMLVGADIVMCETNRDQYPLPTLAKGMNKARAVLAQIESEMTP